MTTPRHSEAAFETVIEHHLLGHGYVAISRDVFDRERAIFPSVVLDFIKDRLVGYSISHVSGRFRSGPLLTQQEASAQEKKGRRYLIDETTAVTRFIFPYSSDTELVALSTYSRRCSSAASSSS